MVDRSISRQIPFKTAMGSSKVTRSGSRMMFQMTFLIDQVRRRAPQGKVQVGKNFGF